MRRALFALGLVVALAAPASADVTLKMTMAMRGGPSGMEGQVTILVKGQRVRTEIAAGPAQQVMIMDVPAGKVIVLKTAEKVAEVWDAAKFQGEMSARMSGPVSVTIGDSSVRPTGQKKSILGATCEERQISATMTFTLQAETAAMTIAGTMWTPVEGPGVAEFVALAKAAKEAGFPFSIAGPFGGQGRGPFGGGQQLDKLFAENGVPSYQGEFTMTFSGEGQMASMMAQMGPMTTTIAATSVSTDPVSEDLFKVPEGFTVKEGGKTVTGDE